MLVNVPKSWADEATRNAQRMGLYYDIIKAMLKELPLERVAYWTDQLRGVDTRRRLLYDCNSKLQNQNNDTTSTNTGNFQPPDEGTSTK
jgi:hypothetical protein